MSAGEDVDAVDLVKSQPVDLTGQMKLTDYLWSAGSKPLRRQRDATGLSE